MKILLHLTPFASRQHGSATLVVSLILLIASTMMVLYTARSSFVEQRVSANEIRAKQAFAAAQAGHDHALAYMNDGGVRHGANPVPPAVPNADIIIPVNMTDGGNESGAIYRVAFCDPAETVVGACPVAIPTPANFSTQVCVNAGGAASLLPFYSREARVISCGWSDDGAARHLVTSIVKGSPVLGTPLTNPLTTKGSVGLNGNVSVSNFYNNLTVWAGGILNKTSATGTTFIRDPDIAIPALPDMNDPASWATYPEAPEPGSCNNPGVYACSTSQAVRGPDVIENDTTLSNMTDNQLFEAVMGLPPADYETTVPTQTNPASLDGLKGEVIWVDGGTALDGDIGTRLEPVVIVVDGDTSIGANTVIYGVVYIRNNVSVSGGPTIFGSVVVEGTVSGAGTMNIIYDPLAAMGANSVGRAGNLPGTWRDWN